MFSTRLGLKRFFIFHIHQANDRAGSSSRFYWPEDALGAPPETANRVIRTADPALGCSSYERSPLTPWHASPQKKGQQPLWLATVMRYYIQPAARRAGITKMIGWHTFRHTFSTLIKSLGVDAKVVQELLRHASFKTTMDGYT